MPTWISILFDQYDGFFINMELRASKSATVPPALHGVLFEIRLFLAGTSSGTSADVRESDRGERDSSLSGGRPPEMPENVAL